MEESYKLSGYALTGVVNACTENRALVSVLCIEPNPSLTLSDPPSTPHEWQWQHALVLPRPEDTTSRSQQSIFTLHVRFSKNEMTPTIPL